VEEFLRWSPNVRSARVKQQAPGAPSPAGGPVERYEDLDAEEILSLLGSLEPADLAALREHEAAHSARAPVLRAIDSLLSRSPARASGSTPRT